MSDREIISQLIEENSVFAVLYRGSASKEAVVALQNMLHELGFADQLKWKIYGADGDYGGSTAAAVAAFATRNQLAGDGQSVTRPIAEKLIARYDFVDELHHLSEALADGKVLQLFYRNSPHATAVSTLQTLLHELGFDQELNWAKYGADGSYAAGTCRAVAAFARQEKIRSDGQTLTDELARRIMARFMGYYGEQFAKDDDLTERLSGEIAIREVIEGGKARVYVSQNGIQARFTRFQNGVYTVGNRKPLDFIQANRSTLGSSGLSDAAVNVMVAVSENEGNLDAVNTWDNSFMTFGMFQWTAGAGSDPGELAALLKKIKAADAAVFEKYFGRYGLDIADTGEIAGYFTLEGKKLASAAEKELLRTHQWAFFFWHSGQDPVVQAIEVQHALSRIASFYRANAYRVKGFYIADWVTSQYGVGLILDQHVNRPAYVKPCLEKALTATGLADPNSLDTDAERKLIEAYLVIRETHGRYPMTHARQRAEVTRKYLQNGTISDERGSFNDT